MSGGSNEAEQISALLLRNEQELLDPAVRRDRNRVHELLAEDFREFGASGRMWTRNEIVELLEREDFQRPAIEDFRCIPIAASAALVTYRAVRIDTATGKSAATLRSSIWTNQEGVWRMRFHQGTPVHDS
jgi:hypothetical protein